MVGASYMYVGGPGTRSLTCSSRASVLTSAAEFHFPLVSDGQDTGLVVRLVVRLDGAGGTGYFL